MRRSVDRTPHDGEHGSALIIALIVITVVGAIIAASLSYLQTSLSDANRATMPERAGNTSADGGMQLAIAYLRAHPTAAAYTGAACPTSDVQYAGDAGTVTVNVCPQPDSFVTTGGAATTHLLTLGTSTKETGIATGSPGDLDVYGNTYSNSTITAAAGSRVVDHQGTVTARKAACSQSGAVPPGGTDPAYVPAVTTLPANGTGSCSGGVATVGPGTYTVAQLQSALGTCTTVWLQPGVFYFNFGTTVWTAKKLKIVGGTPTVTPVKNAPYPGGCSATGPGTQLIFGGASQLALAQGSTLDLCGRDTVEGAKTVKLAIVGLANALGGMAAESGCVITAKKCAVLLGSGKNTAVNVIGTVYTPVAKIDFRPNGVQYAVTDTLVARVLNVAPAKASPAVVIGTAGSSGSTTTPGDVVLSATIGGVAWISARIGLPAGANPTPTVNAWVVQH